MKPITIKLNDMEYRAFCKAHRIWDGTKANPSPKTREFFAKKAVQRMILEQFIKDEVPDNDEDEAQLEWRKDALEEASQITAQYGYHKGFV